MSYFFTHKGLVDVVNIRLKVYKQTHSILTKEAFQQFKAWLNSPDPLVQTVKTRIICPRNRAIDFLCLSLENSQDEITNFCSIIKHFIPTLLGIYIDTKSLNFNVLNRVLCLIQEFFAIAETHDRVEHKITRIRRAYRGWKDRNVDHLHSLCSMTRRDNQEAILNALLLYGL